MPQVTMPQLGEGVEEGTIGKWLKSVGDTVQRDEPLFEISTDKVDAEIPSPAEGVLLLFSVREGETVEINTVVGRIGAAGEQPAATPAAAPDRPVAQAAIATAAPAKPQLDAVSASLRRNGRSAGCRAIGASNSRLYCARA